MKPTRTMPLLPSLEHVATLSDDTGIIQHAIETVPNRSTGYCTDDVARAFIVALMRLRLVPRDALAIRLGSSYLSFMHAAQTEDGRFHNFMSYERDWLEDVGSQDSIGRAMWGLGFGLRYAPTIQWRDVCRSLFDRSLAAVDSLQFPHSRAYAAIGLSHAAVATPEGEYGPPLRRLAGVMLQDYRAQRGEGWEWPMPVMTYDNARLPEALIRAGVAVGDDDCTAAGLRALDFYESVTLLDDIFVPIGNDGWYPRGGERAMYSQQPLEAAAMVDCELLAFDATGEQRRLVAAQTALAWYYGRNTGCAALAHGGGCHDGLDIAGVNHNMGAESTLALLAGSYAIAERQNRSQRASKPLERAQL